MFEYYVAAVIAVLITAFAQLFLKLGAMYGKSNNSLLHSYLNPHTIFAYSLLLLASLLNIYAYKYINLKIAVVLLPVIYLLVALLSFKFLRERFSKNNFIGATIILIGIIIFGL